MANGPVGTIRKPIVIILLSIVTLGIYSLYVIYATFKEMKDYSGQGIGGGIGLLLGFFVGFVLWFMYPSEVANLYKAEGQEPPVTPVVGLWNLLPIIGSIIWLYKVQGALNSFWEAHGATVS
jgi:hypothetical protein